MHIEADQIELENKVVAAPSDSTIDLKQKVVSFMYPLFASFLTPF